MLSSGDMTRAASGDGLPYVQTVPSSPAFESDSRDSRADTADSRADTEADEARRNGPTQTVWICDTLLNNVTTDIYRIYIIFFVYY